MIRSHVLICGGTGCTSSGSKVLMSTFEEELKKQGLEDEIKIVQTGCFGLCALGPVVIVYPEGTFYSHVKKEDVAEIVEEHLLKGRLVDRLVYKDVAEEVKDAAVRHVSLNDTNFYKTQKRVALRNCGLINPENIDEYIAMDGYAALGKVLTEMTPEQVIQEVKDSETVKPEDSAKPGSVSVTGVTFDTTNGYTVSYKVTKEIVGIYSYSVKLTTVNGALIAEKSADVQNPNWTAPKDFAGTAVGTEKKADEANVAITFFDKDGNVLASDSALIAL